MKHLLILREAWLPGTLHCPERKRLPMRRLQRCSLGWGGLGPDHGQRGAGGGPFRGSDGFLSQNSHRPDLALTCREYADTLLQQNGPGDREKAMSVMEEALAISRELGMLPLTERIIMPA